MNWISVEDMWPPEKGTYLIYIVANKPDVNKAGGEITISYFVPDFAPEGLRWSELKVDKKDQYGWHPTHWMPLPKPPKEYVESVDYKDFLKAREKK